MLVTVMWLSPRSSDLKIGLFQFITVVFFGDKRKLNVSTGPPGERGQTAGVDRRVWSNVPDTAIWLVSTDVVLLLVLFNFHV